MSTNYDFVITEVIGREERFRNDCHHLINLAQAHHSFLFLFCSFSRRKTRKVLPSEELEYTKLLSGLHVAKRLDGRLVVLV